MWPLPLSIAVFLAPESPWWLVRKNRIEDAKKSLHRLTSPQRDTEFDADETGILVPVDALAIFQMAKALLNVVAMIAHTTALEEQITAGATYLDCFKASSIFTTQVLILAE